MATGTELITGAGRERPGAPADLIEFVHRSGSYIGTGRGSRAWRITHKSSGWCLEFRDPGDAESTYAGTHASMEAAQREANCVYRGLGGRRPPRQRRA